jgi:hypothetical protein
MLHKQELHIVCGRPFGLTVLVCLFRVFAVLTLAPVSGTNIRLDLSRLNSDVLSIT